MMRTFAVICVALVAAGVLTWITLANQPKKKVQRMIKVMESKERKGWKPKGPIGEEEAEWKNALAAFGRDAIEPVVRYYRAHHGSKDFSKLYVASMVIDVLDRIDDRTAVPDLLELAQGPDRKVSFHAIRGLARNCTKAQLGQITELVSSLPDDWIAHRTDLVEILGRFKGKDVRDILRSYLDDQDAATRKGALRAIACSADATFLPTVKHMMHNDGDVYVRGAAAETAARLGDKAGVEYLLGLLGMDRSSLDVYVGAEGVGRLKEASAVPRLSELLTNKDENISLFAQRALWHIDTPEALRALKDAGMDEWRLIKD
jgi:HEAT repeat protein